MPGSEEEAIDTPKDVQSMIPESPPPPFRSRASSIAFRRQPSQTTSRPVDQTLADTFDTSPNDYNNDGIDDDRQRLMRDAVTTSQQPSETRQALQRAATSFPSMFGVGRNQNSGPSAISNDGVFANLNAKPERGEKLEEQPPVRHQSCFSTP